LKVFAHAPLLDHAKDALKAGADGLLHGILDRPVDQEFIDLMRRNRAVYVPTLSLYEDTADVAAWAKRQAESEVRPFLLPLAQSFMSFDGERFRAQFNNFSFVKSQLPTSRANLLRVFGAGIPVVMGTDTGFIGVLVGIASQLELVLMVEAGLTPDAALRAATINAARMMGREKESGSVEPGKLADLLVLDANPLDDVSNVRRIFRVIRGGAVFDPAELLSGIRFTAPPPRIQ
jgi:imidazolonepropionase-like amidohydrolase